MSARTSCTRSLPSTTTCRTLGSFPARPPCDYKLCALTSLPFDSSVKGLLYQDYMNGPEEVRKQFYTDPMLANGNGHDRASSLPCRQ